jgi:hypothetical protein
VRPRSAQRFACPYLPSFPSTWESLSSRSAFARGIARHQFARGRIRVGRLLELGRLIPRISQVPLYGSDLRRTHVLEAMAGFQRARVQMRAFDVRVEARGALAGDRGVTPRDGYRRRSGSAVKGSRRSSA